MKECPVSFILISSLIIFSSSSFATDTLNATQSVRVGDTLVSSDGIFQLGFFSRGSSGNWYLGMWYSLDATTVVWVANRDVPIANTTGVVLSVIQPGILALLNNTNGVIWSSNTSTSLQNPVAQLLDSGNLVVRDANDDRPDNFVWQSFDHPADTYLSGMRIAWNLVTGFETYYSSWRGVDDPAPGDFTFHLDPTGFPQLVLKRGDVVQSRIGPWNGQQFSGDPVRQSSTNRVSFVMSENEVSYATFIVPSASSRFTLNQTGAVQSWTWVDRRGWIDIQTLPADICDTYSLCGANGICTVGNSRPCACLDRFVRRGPDEQWVSSDWTNGCMRRRNLSCESDTFLTYSGIKLPDARNSTHNTSMTLDECRWECLRDCSCMAYTQLDIVRKTGCLFWYGELIDIRSTSLNAQDIYIRMASSESEIEGKVRQILLPSLTSVIGVALIGLGLFIYIKNKNGLKAKRGLYDGIHHKDLVLPLFDISVILAATDNFRNKIGQGGFGPVYKGMLEGGQEIAVKRLSKDSKQGLSEFKNEIVFIAKLQHRNLVRLLGCCIKAEETMLVYEYMPNKSLDVLLFDQTKRTLLDWPTRFHIINGVARGLMYLHQDSRLRIIHRDLKASNVLLDSEMNPKISDFGMAKCFLGNETEARTRRVVGTYGYMAPEYAVDGLFSMKSDVFSFGVLILEIVSGSRNRCFVHNDHSFNLLGHASISPGPGITSCTYFTLNDDKFYLRYVAQAWTLYNEGRLEELVDDCLRDSYDFEEVVRTIHVGLLCVQNKQEDRPTMSNVVHMLDNQGVVLPQAKHPGFFTERDVLSTDQNPTATCSTNEVTITMPAAR